MISKCNFFYLSLLAFLLFSTTLNAAQCLPDLGDGKICGANDFVLSELKITGPDSCTEGEIITQAITVRIGLEPTANERYDIGLFVGDHGESPIGGESCTFSSLSPLEVSGNFDGASGSGPYRDLDSNQCGDTLKGDGAVYKDIILNDVLCQDKDNDGNLDIAYALSWQQQKVSCDNPSNPGNFYPPTSSKCIVGVGNLSEVVTLPPPPHPSIKVSKNATPRIIETPGAEVSYFLTLYNDGNVPVTVTGLDDDTFDATGGSSTCSLPQYLEPGESYFCRFTAAVTGNAGETHTNIITATAEDNDGATATDSDNSTVLIVDVTNPTASIGNLVWNDLNGDGFYSPDEPGLGNVTVTLSRDSGNGYVIMDTTSTTADGHYAFAALPAGSYRVTPDTSTAPLNHMIHTGGVLPHDVILSDDMYYPFADFAFSKASIAVTKTADPSMVPAPAATVTYTITVENDGAVEVLVTTLHDSVFGDLGNTGCNLPQLLAAGDSFSCTFSETITGEVGDTHDNTVTTLGRDAAQHPVLGADSAQVSFIDGNNAAIGHFVWNDLNADGLYSSGEPFFDNVTLALSGTATATTTTKFGGLYSFPNLAQGAYTVTVSDENTILQDYVLTASNAPYPTQLSAGEVDALHNFGYAKAEISIDKTADKQIIFAPGDNVGFTFTVTNSGSVDLLITDLDDNQFGNLGSECTLPQNLGRGEQFTCTISRAINGNAGDTHNNVVTVTAEDGGGHAFTASDNEHVRIIDDLGGAIGHLVWLDSDGDGVRDSGEQGINGVSVDLLQNGSVIDTTVTSMTGQYHFLTANGTYTVQVTDRYHILDGTSLSSGPNPHTGIAVNNSIFLGANFGYTMGQPPPLPSLKLEKATNGQDADDPPGPTIKAGNNVSWSYVVTNTGPYFLTNVTVEDNQGVAVSCPKDTLEFNEIITCSGSGRAVKGQYENIGTASATAAKYGPIVDSDPSHYFCKGFPWVIFPPPTPCATMPLYCYMIADLDNQGSHDSRLFKYTFRQKSLEPVNYLGVTDIETMTNSLDGRNIYAVNGGVLGTIDPTPGITDSFSPINPSGLGTGYGAYGTVRYDDIDGLSFDPSDGTLYGTVRYRELSPGIMDLLIKIDPATGMAIKNGFGTGQDYIIIDTEAAGVKDCDDIVIDHEGIMYGVAGNSGGGGGDQGVIIDKKTGAVRLNAPLATSEGQPIQDMEGFSRYNRKYFYGTTGVEFSEQQTDNSLYKIEKTTGTAEFIIRLDQNFDGYVPRDFEAVSCFPICK